MDNAWDKRVEDTHAPEGLTKKNIKISFGAWLIEIVIETFISKAKLIMQVSYTIEHY